MVPFRQNDVIQQTVALGAVGLFIGGAYGHLATWNIKSEEMVYQRFLWPRWKVVQNERYSYQLKEMRRCAFIMGVYLGTFAAVDGLLANYRQKDDFVNPFWAGIASGFSAYVTRGKFFNNMAVGVCFAICASMKRQGWNRIDEDKLMFNRESKWCIRPRGIEWVLPDESPPPVFRPGA